MSAKDHLQPDQFMARRKKQLDDDKADEHDLNDAIRRHPAGKKMTPPEKRPTT